MDGRCHQIWGKLIRGRPAAQVVKNSPGAEQRRKKFIEYTARELWQDSKAEWSARRQWWGALVKGEGGEGEGEEVWGRMQFSLFGTCVQV